MIEERVEVARSEMGSSPLLVLESGGVNGGSPLASRELSLVARTGYCTPFRWLHFPNQASKGSGRDANNMVGPDVERGGEAALASKIKGICIMQGGSLISAGIGLRNQRLPDMASFNDWGHELRRSKAMHDRPQDVDQGILPWSSQY